MTEPEEHMAALQVCLDKGDLAQALVHVNAVLDTDDTRVNLITLRGTLSRGLGNMDEAVANYRRSLELQPVAEVHNDLGNLLRRDGHVEEAAEHYRAAIALKPDMADAHVGLGIVHKEQRDYEAALACYHTALEKDPSSLQACNNLGTACQDLGRLDEAMAHFDRAVEINPDYVPAHVHRALLKMLTGRWKDGFEEYQWRWHMDSFASPHTTQTWWDGGPLEGRTILFHGEQGMGDVLQFVRFAAFLKDFGGRVIVEAPKRLLRLLSTVPGIDELVAKGDPVPDFDVHMPMMTLPLVMGWAPDTLPVSPAYIAPDPDLVEHWRGRLGPPKGKRIGISWQGNPSYRADYFRSPSLKAFEPLLRQPGLEFFSLQKGYGSEQLAGLPDDISITDLSAQLDTGPDAFVDTAAVMACMDLLVMSDTAIIHLAGAMGRPVWVPLPHIPDWRFLTDTGDRCVWYSTMRLFRQTSRGDWDGVFARIAAEVGP